MLIGPIALHGLALNCPRLLFLIGKDGISGNKKLNPFNNSTLPAIAKPSHIQGELKNLLGLLVSAKGSWTIG